MANYRLQWVLRGHKGPINCVDFTDDGVALASGADDGHVVVWSLADGELSRRLRPKQGPVVSLRWLPSMRTKPDYLLLLGGADGTIQVWRISHNLEYSERLAAHTTLQGSVEDITINDSGSLIVVTGAGRAVIFAVTIDIKCPIKFISSEPPFSQASLPAVMRNGHFFNEDTSVMLTFLDAKEVMAWNVSPWKFLWRHKLQTRIGCSAWNEAARTLLVWNLYDGIDIYHLKDDPTNRLELVRKLRVKVKVNRINLVRFDTSGKVAISGSDNGEVYLWEIKSGQRIQTLTHEKEMYAVQTIACHSPQHAKHWIASAGSDSNDERPCVMIWTTQGNRLPVNCAGVGIQANKEARGNRGGCSTASLMWLLAGLTVISLALYVQWKYQLH
ncbi:WD40-repeat-containing domain protein [Hygrophoropsis aurantiaca]|uniref:WD40-repeat-containing domain protein n=1 Tax=Hygrophoropsis aurantiaca TaxID=72124 RepID=A0ACB8A0Z7_9AGAM|nr:WD40-repeat-containing domain protein [Hygrophoropsis aurantiaca]